MTPPAMAPVFELCLTTGVDVPVFEDPVLEAETQAGELDAPGTVPGPSSGVSIKVIRGRETVNGGIREENSHHQWCTICWNSNSSLSGTGYEHIVREESLEKRTVTSRRAHWGRRVPEGIGLGNLWVNYYVDLN